MRWALTVIADGLSLVAEACNMTGIVCAGQDIAYMRCSCRGIWLIVPGHYANVIIRMSGRDFVVISSYYMRA